MTYKKIRKCFLIPISLLAFGFLFSCKNQSENNVPDKKKPSVTSTELEAIEVAIVGEKKGKPVVADFKLLEGFSSEKYGPYTMEEAKTAYIEIKMKVGEPSSGDFAIEAVNKTTYIPPVSFQRKAEDQNGYFKQNRITLSKGANTIEIKVKSPDGSKEGVYTIIVQYGGGPDPNTIAELEQRKIIPGIYCPTQRKPLDGEKSECVWLICVAGWCGACPDSLKLAGSGGANLTDKYKDKGLRVVAVDRDGSQINETVKKWKAAGANYPLYTVNYCSFAQFYKDLDSYPTSYFIKNLTLLKEIKGNCSEEDVKNTFGF